MSIQQHTYGKLSLIAGITGLGTALFSIWGAGMLSDIENAHKILSTTSIALAFIGLILAAISFIQKDPNRLIITGISFALLTIAFNFILIAIGVFVIVFIIFYFYSGG